MAKTSIAGQKFGRLTLIEATPLRAPNREILWKAVCDCGRNTVARPSVLRYGQISSCGCFRAELNSAKAKRAADARAQRPAASRDHPLAYKTWESMHSRCSNPKSDDFARYGGRGISVCEEWKDFYAFLRDMGDRPAGMSIDRIDVDGNYEPGNCRWVDRKQQARNRRTNRLITHRGETHSLAEWAEIAGLAQSLLLDRLNRGWSPERALTEPPNVKFRPRK